MFDCLDCNEKICQYKIELCSMMIMKSCQLSNNNSFGLLKETKSFLTNSCKLSLDAKVKHKINRKSDCMLWRDPCITRKKNDNNANNQCIFWKVRLPNIYFFLDWTHICKGVEREVNPTLSLYSSTLINNLVSVILFRI
jgi:hypothetical protein